MEKRAYSTLEIKAVNDDKREITGIASTPSPDRMSDVVVPEGAKFTLPIPLLWQHDHLQPIGEVYAAKITSKGIEIKARMVKVASPSQLSARLDEAWESVKSGLVRGLSIGFRPIEYAFIENGGVRFDEWDFYELSCVTVPANSQANITSIKSLDSQILAAIGNKEADGHADKTPLSDVRKLKTTTYKLSPKEGNMIKKISEQLEALNSDRLAKTAQMETLMLKSAETGVTLDEAEAEEFDTLVTEVDAIAKQVARLQILEKAQAVTARAVTEATGNSEKTALAVRSAAMPIVKTAKKSEPGIEFARYVMCLTAAKGDLQQAHQLAKAHYADNDRVVKTLEFQSKGGKYGDVMKATVEAGTTLDATWAAPLVDYQNFTGDFIEYLRPRTIIGQFGTGNIPALRSIPFNVRITGASSGGNANWVGEGAPKPVTAFDFLDVELRWSKIAAIAVLTEELIRFSNPSAERLVRDSLADAVIARMDVDFINPAKTAVANVSPASITNGAIAIPSSGSDADAVRCDIKALWAPFIAARNAPRQAVYIMDSSTALSLSLMTNPLGQSEFPGLTLNGGTFMGVPTIVSDYVPVDSDGGMIVLVNASDIYLADEGQVTVDASREASIQMLDNPTNNSATGTPTTMVSMFQTNSVALRAERYINWAKRRASAVAYLTGVNYGDC